VGRVQSAVDSSSLLGQAQPFGDETCKTSRTPSASPTWALSSTLAGPPEVQALTSRKEVGGQGATGEVTGEEEEVGQRRPLS
jgi:hypothetical protein